MFIFIYQHQIKNFFLLFNYINIRTFQEKDFKNQSDLKMYYLCNNLLKEL